MTSKDRMLKDTPVRSTKPRAVHKRMEGARVARPVSVAPGSSGQHSAGMQPEAALVELRSQLQQHVGDLRFVYSAMVVCIQALQLQNADSDADIAHVLQRTIGDQLDATTDRIEALTLGIDLEEVEAALA